MKQSLNVARAFKQHIGGRIPTPKKRSRIGINRTIPPHFSPPTTGSGDNNIAEVKKSQENGPTNHLQNKPGYVI